jgi:alkylation response protein AidB-like acyl-CoA dehydrogenase
VDLDFTEEQQMLAELARGLCDQYCPVESVRAAENDGAGYSAELWSQLGEAGLVGLLLPEDLGGGAQTPLEGAILYEELGRALAPTPHFVSAVLCGQLLVRAAADPVKKEWVPKLASGEALFSLAWLEPERSSEASGVGLRAVRRGEGWSLSGVKRHVHHAGAAARLLVLARTGDGEGDVGIFLVDPSDPACSLVQHRTLASEAQYELRLTDLQLPSDALVGEPTSGWAHFEGVLLGSIILAAAQAVGGAQRALEITVEYAKERKQFGKPIGAFQSISHYLADAATRIAGARTLVHQAAWAASTGAPIDRLAPMSKLYACQTFRDVTAMCQQVWGGVGFTVEYDIQLYFRRAKQLQLSWWDDRQLEERIARSALP